MTDGSTRTVFIAGPTASGKSAAALELAESLGGEIVNADALQVYADLRILSARPGDAELARTPHHLYGFLDGGARCSAGLWSRRAAEIIAGIGKRKRVAIVVGGTGLYFKALEEGLSPIPEVPDETRLEARRRLEALGPEAFRAELVARDPEVARLQPADTVRHLRALEVLLATGRPISEFQKTPRRRLVSPPVARVVIEPQRDALYAACDARFEMMMATGGLEEARSLSARGLDPELPVMKALGVQELIAHLRGAMSRGEAVDLAKRNTRRLAKRQLTWFRHQAPDWPRSRDGRASVTALKSSLP